MRVATKSVAAWFGLTAGLSGTMHGYFEILQGNAKPGSLVITSIGPPCVPEEVWNSCEPAMTIVPNFLITGILAVIFGLVILVWSLAFIQRRHGGLMLIVLSLILLLFGGGFFPPLIGIVGGIAGLKINQPLSARQSSGMLRFAARLWPWPMIIFLVWVFGQIAVGYFFNEILQRFMWFGILLIFIALPLSVYCAYAYDLQNVRGEE